MPGLGGALRAAFEDAGSADDRRPVADLVGRLEGGPDCERVPQDRPLPRADPADPAAGRPADGIFSNASRFLTSDLSWRSYSSPGLPPAYR